MKEIWMKSFNDVNNIFTKFSFPHRILTVDVNLKPHLDCIMKSEHIETFKGLEHMFYFKLIEKYIISGSMTISKSRIYYFNHYILKLE